MSPSNDQPNAWGAATGAYKKPQPATGATQPPSTQTGTAPAPGSSTAWGGGGGMVAPSTSQPPVATSAPTPAAQPTAGGYAQNMQQQHPQSPPSRSYYGEQGHPPQMQGTQPPPHQQMHQRVGAPEAPQGQQWESGMVPGGGGAVSMDSLQGDSAPQTSSFLGSEPMGSPDSYLSGGTPPPATGDAMPMQGDAMGSHQMRQRRNRVM